MIPLVSLAFVVVRYRNAIDQIEKVPAFRDAFQASRGALDALADDILTGQPPSAPYAAGRFVITSWERLPAGAVVLYTRADEEEPARWGFVRAPEMRSEQARASQIGISGRVGEENTVDRLQDDWFVLFSTWHFVKRGWS